MKRFPFQPEPIDVITVGNLPSRVVLKRRLRRVREVCNLWRIDDGWWFKPITRLYYTLDLDGGGRITVFRDIAEGRWYRQDWPS